MDPHFKLGGGILPIPGFPIQLQVEGDCSKCDRPVNMELVTLYPLYVARVRCQGCGHILIDGVESLRSIGWPGPGEPGYTGQSE